MKTYLEHSPGPWLTMVLVGVVMAFVLMMIGVAPSIDLVIWGK